MPLRHRTLSLVFVPMILMLATVACGDSEERVVVNASEAAFVPVVESSDVFVGVPRLVLTLLEQDSQPQFADGARFLIRYFEPTEGGVKFHSEAETASDRCGGISLLRRRRRAVPLARYLGHRGDRRATGRHRREQPRVSRFWLRNRPRG